MKKFSIPGFKFWFYQGKQYFTDLPVLIWLNILTLVVLSTLSIYAKIKSKGSGIENLFSDPFYLDSGIFYLGWLTSVSEILWCTAIAICLFSACLISTSNRRFQIFLFASASVMLLLFFDDLFRTTLMLCFFFGTCQVVKLSVYAIYGCLLICYAWVFRRTIAQTPYVPLLISFFLFGFSSAIDVAPINSRGFHAMLEDGTKLIGLINLTFYFWWICQQEIKKNILSQAIKKR
ncbi:hypothetical protein IQ255_04795 [Pleurocapsales cyanobacterium LEGE 10410]|nr:hypothetical protein [Pleurocapsales cyanobacterium LEGE 10410]